MPKLVDHDERRTTIIETTWEIIASQGMENATMRDIAAACGYAGPGVIGHYFPNKDALLLASYELICQRTNERIDRAVMQKTGLRALLAMCLEIIPAEELTRTEARVAVAFWQRAQTDSKLRAVGAATLGQWRARMLSYLSQAQVAGEVADSIRVDQVVDELLNVMMGLHITSMLDPQQMSESGQRRLLRAMIDALQVP